MEARIVGTITLKHIRGHQWQCAFGDRLFQHNLTFRHFFRLSKPVIIQQIDQEGMLRVRGDVREIVFVALRKPQHLLQQ